MDGLLLHPLMVCHELASLLPREELRAVPHAAAFWRGDARRPMELRAPGVREDGAGEGGRSLHGGGGGTEGETRRQNRGGGRSQWEQGRDNRQNGWVGREGKGRGKKKWAPIVEMNERNEGR